MKPMPDGLVSQAAEAEAAEAAREEIALRSHPAVLRVLTPGARPAQTYGHLPAPAEAEPESWVVVDPFEEIFTLTDALSGTGLLLRPMTADGPGARPGRVAGARRPPVVAAAGRAGPRHLRHAAPAESRRPGRVDQFLRVSSPV
ncbi:hypothetical protein [Streptomyces sp. YKOK-I1]